MAKAWLSLCLAMNFRKTQFSARFVAMAIPKIRSSFSGGMPSLVMGIGILRIRQSLRCKLGGPLAVDE